MTSPIITAAGVISLIPNLGSATPQGNIGGIDIDATLEEIHHGSVQVTEHPVEQGALITDHSFMRPVEVLLRCGWSNSSPSVLDTITEIFTSGSLSVDDYVGGIYSQLKALQERRTPFSIVTTLRTYQNMMLTSLQIVRDAKSANALMVTATCREVIIVSTQSTSLPPVAAQAFPIDTAPMNNVGTLTLLQGAPDPRGAVPPSQWQTQ